VALSVALAGAVTVLALDSPAPAAPVYARAIFVNGTVVTVDPRRPLAEALAVAPDGTILAVGDLESVKKTMRPDGMGITKIVDLDGKTLMPGFVEPHTHAFMTAFTTHMMALPPARPGSYIVHDLSSFDAKWPTIAEIQTQLKTALKDVPPGGWLVAFGVDPSRTTKFMDTLDVGKLDEVSKDVPIFIVNQSGHFAYVNTKAFHEAGITDDTPDPLPGKYLKEGKHLTGVLQEAPAYAAFQAKIDQSPTGKMMTPAAQLAALRKTYQCFAETGVTTATEISLGLVTGSVSEEYKLLRTLASEGPPVRLRAYVAAMVTSPEKLGMNPNQGDDLLKVIGIKFVEDGSTQGLTAALSERYDYPPGTDNKGDANYTTDQLFKAATEYAKAGWQLSIHSNGDDSTARVLKVYGQLLGVDPNYKPIASEQKKLAARRWRIEHFTVVDRDQIAPVWNMGLTPSLTNGHVYFWGYSFDEKKILGSERAQLIDPAKWLLDREIRFSFNSDSPITPVSPLRYVSTAVTRNYQNGVAPLGAGQKIRAEAAIRAVTIDAAYQLFLDDQVGSLEVGKLADLVILDENPLDPGVKDIMKIKVLATYLAESTSTRPALRLRARPGRRHRPKLRPEQISGAFALCCGGERTPNSRAAAFPRCVAAAASHSGTAGSPARAAAC
jgi:predicted amidohydrolase YtcJ